MEATFLEATFLEADFFFEAFLDAAFFEVFDARVAGRFDVERPVFLEEAVFFREAFVLLAAIRTRYYRTNRTLKTLRHPPVCILRRNVHGDFTPEPQ